MGDLALIFDTETTGLFNYKLRAHQKGQPRLCTLAASLVDMETGDVVESMYRINNGEDWDVDDWREAELGEAFKINNLTTSYLRKMGQPIMTIIRDYYRMVDRCVGISAYSVAYDQKVIRGEARRNNMDDRYGERPTYDPMWECRKFIGAGKTVKLIEMYRRMFGEDFPGAHTAQGDRDAAVRIFNHARVNGGITWKAQVSKEEMATAAPAGHPGNVDPAQYPGEIDEHPAQHEGTARLPENPTEAEIERQQSGIRHALGMTDEELMEVPKPAGMDAAS